MEIIEGGNVNGGIKKGEKKWKEAKEGSKVKEREKGCKMKKRGERGGVP